MLLKYSYLRQLSSMRQRDQLSIAGSLCYVRLAGYPRVMFEGWLNIFLVLGMIIELITQANRISRSLVIYVHNLQNQTKS